MTSTAALSLSALLAACGKDSAGAASSADATVSVKHVFGTTNVPANPKRVATVAWGNQDVALALGILPVGMPKQTWGVTDDSGMLEWTKAKVDELVKAGGTQPKLWDETDSLDFEAVAAAKPDVILAGYSGITKEDYQTLSKIAPTVAYPKVPWAAPWREWIRLDAAGLGQAEGGEALIKSMESRITKALADYPEIAGKRAAFCFGQTTDMSSIGFYTPADPRTGFLADLGLKLPDSVSQAAAKDPNTFYYNISSENADTFADMDLMVMYGEEKDLATLQSNPLLNTIPAIKHGAIAFVGNGSPLSAAVNPTPLSLDWGIDKYVALVGAAAAKVK